MKSSRKAKAIYIIYIISVFVFFYLPIIFVGLNYVEHKRAYNAAQAYLAQFAPNMAVQATTENQP